jgi:CheY-like chemotaxis protein
MNIDTARCPILLVEDDANDVFFFERALHKAEVPSPMTVVSDGQEAIDLLAGKEGFADREKFPLPCLIVLDLNLPRKNGLQVLDWIRQNPEFEPVIVIVFTSSTSEQDMRDAYRLGANSYLVKPSDPDELVDLVKLISLYWLGANQSPPRQPRLI